MLLSINWLKEFIDLPVSLETIAEKLTVTGNEIEEIIRPCANVKGVRIAKIVELSQHPTKDGLKVAKLHLGGDEYHICLTTAPNVKLGDVIPWFAPGACTIEGMELGVRDFGEGFVSAGMMASAKELGVPDLTDEYGILMLPQDAPLGADAGKWLGLDDTVFDMSVTPNRGDMLSVLGAAIEIHALFPECRLHIPEIPLPAYDGEWTLPFEGITLESEGCRAYRLGLADSVKIARAPLQAGVRLCMAGMRPINNIVDATNYTMLALGQPLHAFDAKSLPAANIGVRQARADEEIVTLDGKTHKLLESDMVITSGGTGVALAGVMGGQNSEITNDTKHVLLESANFTSPYISKTSRRLGIPSEASFRYARGVDPLLTEKAAYYCLHLMEQWGGVRAFRKTLYATNGEIKPARVPLTMKKLHTIIGWAEMDKAAEYLGRLGIEKVSGDTEKAEFEVPTRRTDISIEEDLIEEVGRIRGYDEIEPTIPELHRSGTLGPVLSLQRLVRSVAIARGYTEAVTLSFVSPDSLKLIRYPDADKCLAVANPISVDMSVMRPTILPALLHGISKAVHGGWRDPIRVFECGHVFLPCDGGVKEVDRVCGVSFAGKEKRVLYPALAENFMSVKGDVEAIAQSCGARLTFRQAQRPDGHAGQTAEILKDGVVVGYLMRLKADIAAQLDLDTPVYAFELDMTALADRPLPKFAKTNAYPPVFRDISMLVAKDVPADAVIADIRACGGDLLDTVKLFDIYEGKGVPEGFRSMAFSVVYREAARTLKDAEVESEHGEVRLGLEKKGYTLR